MDLVIFVEEYRESYIFIHRIATMINLFTFNKINPRKWKAAEITKSWSHLAFITWFNEANNTMVNYVLINYLHNSLCNAIDATFYKESNESSFFI